MKIAGRDRRRVDLVLFLISFATFAYFYQGADQSTAARFDLMRSLVERHTLWIDGYAAFNTADIVALRGHVYSVKAPGAAFTGLLPWIVFSTLLAPLAQPHEALFWALSTYLTIVFSTGLLVALLIVIVNRFALFLGAGPGRSAAIALVLAFGTIVFPYATEMTGEPIAGVCAFGAFYLLATYRLRPDATWALWAGFLAGWAVLCDYPAILVALGLAVYALVKLPRLKDRFGFALGAASVAFLLLAYNRAAFGSPIFFSYEAYKLPANSQFPEQAVGFVGLTYPRLFILWKILIDSQRGLWFCNPVLILVIPALVCFYRRREFRAEFMVTAFAAASFVLFNASFGRSIVSWGGGTATGPRQIAAAVPFMVLTLAFLPRQWDYLLGALAFVSALVMLAATSVEPHFPYEYANPVGDFVMPAYFRGDLAYNRDAYFGGAPIVGQSVAFNLGKVAGLGGALQLWPLAGIWIVGAAALIRSLRDAPSRQREFLVSSATAIAIAAMFLPPAFGSLDNPAPTGPLHGLLGRYYEGLDPGGFPPHIVRVDPQLDFRNVAALGGLPPPSCAIWSGELLAPRSGLYLFAIVADDTGWLDIDGVHVIRDPGPITRELGIGHIYLTAGPHRIIVGERNLWGDAGMLFYWTPPGGRQELVPAQVLIADSAAARGRGTRRACVATAFSF